MVRAGTVVALCANKLRGLQDRPLQSNEKSALVFRELFAERDGRVSKFNFTSDLLPSELPARIRAKMWAESMRAIGSSFDMGIVTSRKFRGELAVLPLGKVQIGAATTVADAAVTVTRTDALIAQDRDDRLMIVINRGDTIMHVRQIGRDAKLKTGEMSVVAMNVPTECYTARSGCSHVVMVPREMIDQPGQVLERYAATRLEGNEGSRRLLSNHIRDLLEENDPLDAGTEAAAGEYVASLAASVLRLPGAKPAKPAESDARVRMMEVRKQIAKSYHTATLTADGIGKPLGLSGRSIQHLLKQNGTTFSGELESMRLEAAFAMLKSASKAKIAEIAFKCGFADLSTFHRAFRERYGDTPNAFRAGEGGGK